MTFSAVEPLVFYLPLWLGGLVLIALTLAAREVGAWLARRSRRARAAKGVAETDISSSDYIVGPIFGLLAFLIGLTFSIALDRYDDRRSWIGEEATAISTTYLRSDLLEDPSRSRLKATLYEYAKGRIAPEGVWNARTQELLDRSDATRVRLWRETRATVYPIRQTELASHYVEAMNAMLTIGTRRALAGRAHVPPRILDTLILYLLVASGTLGYLISPSGRGFRQASTLLLILFVIAIVLILDIDRPQAGSIRIPQTAMENLVAYMEADGQGRQAVQVSPPVR